MSLPDPGQRTIHRAPGDNPANTELCVIMWRPYPATTPTRRTSGQMAVVGRCRRLALLAPCPGAWTRPSGRQPRTPDADRQAVIRTGGLALVDAPLEVAHRPIAVIEAPTVLGEHGAQLVKLVVVARADRQGHVAVQ